MERERKDSDDEERALREKRTTEEAVRKRNEGVAGGEGWRENMGGREGHQDI